MAAATVLCPVDFSDESRHALRWARAIAERRGATLIVLHVVDPLLAEAARVHAGLTLRGPETEHALREFLATAAPEDRTAADRAAFRVGVGEPAEIILEQAERDRPLLIVMGTHGLGGLQKMLLGSTTERVLRRARHPVLAVPLSPDRSPEARDPLREIRRMLVGTDFTAASIDAVRWAAAFARDFGASLLIVHIVVPTKVAPAWQPLVEQADQSRVEEARRRMEELSGEFPGLAVETIVALDRAEDALASLADQRDAGLIVLGLSSEEGAFAPHPGSIAYRVLCLAAAPVLLVPRSA